MDTMNLPPTFTMQGDYVVTPAYGSFMRVWTVKEYDGSRLSAGEIRNVRRLVVATGQAFLTPAMGKLGWNVRASFPRNWVDRDLPFVWARSDGSLWRYSPTGSVRRAD